ncbi:MAG: general secretion pathway protein GspK [Deltaproteobacteria bacterium]|nr:general secretion pathway protein GspK [Deltaproteobacteria bacterium]
MKSSRGIALMMVISSIMLLSMIVLEFVFSSNVSYKLALNEKERLQAYFLAESALNLMKIELKIDRQLKSAISSSPIAQNLPIDLSMPMCQQFPFSTGLIRAFFVGGAMPLMKGKEGGEEEKSKSATVFETESAEEFLSFDGDFDGSCADEQGKFNLNYFAGLDPMQQTLSGVNPYDMYKITLINFLKGEKFKKLFEGMEQQKIAEIVRNIADWTDKNDIINDIGLVTLGQEGSLYKGENAPKNVKFLSLDEVHMVEGVDDRWFTPIEDMFTVYGENKINVCVADDDVVWALIVAYASQNPNIPPLDPKNLETKKKFVDALKLSCGGTQPQASKIASDLDAALGITSAEGSGGGGKFAEMITTEARYYSLKLTGQVGETVVNIKTVLDIKDPDPKKWKMLYYKVF